MVKNPPANEEDGRDAGSIPGLGRSHGEGTGNPLQYSCLENPHGQRSLAGYSPWSQKEWGTTQWLSTQTHTTTGKLCGQEHRSHSEISSHAYPAEAGYYRKGQSRKQRHWQFDAVTQSFNNYLEEVYLVSYAHNTFFGCFSLFLLFLSFYAEVLYVLTFNQSQNRKIHTHTHNLPWTRRHCL